jgi:hypothetical protein
MPKNRRNKVRRAVSRVRAATRGRRAQSAWGQYAKIEKGVGSGAIVKKVADIIPIGFDPLIVDTLATVAGAARGGYLGGLGALLIDTDLLNRMWGMGTSALGGGQPNGGGL